MKGFCFAARALVAPVALAVVAAFCATPGCGSKDDDEDVSLGGPDAGAGGAAAAKHSGKKVGDDVDVAEDPGGPHTSAGPEEKEPNDDRGKASAVESEKKILGKIFNADATVADVDWFKIEVPDKDKPQKMTVELGALAGADLTFEVFKGPNKVVAVDDHKEDGVGEALVGLGVKPGPYFVKVAAKPSAGEVFFDKAKRYSLEVKVEEVKEGGEVEPNDSVASAQPVKAGAALTGNFSVAGDTDYFTIGSDGMEPGSVMSIAVTAVNNVAMSLTILDGIKDRVKSASGGMGEKLSVKNVGVKPENAPYYLALKATSGSNPDMDYTMTVTLTKLAGDAELEPNDDPVHATPIEGGKRVTAFFSKGDKDVYKVTVPDRAIARVEVEGVAEVNLKVRLIDDKGNAVSKTVNENGPGEGEVITNWAIPVGDTYIEVSGGGSNDDLNYSVGLGLLPDDGTYELEPNNNKDEATPISFDPGDGTKSRRGYVSPKGDSDFYVLDIGFGKEVTAFIKCSGIAKVDINVDVLSEAGEKIEELKSAKVGYPEEKEVKLNGNRFFIVVKGASSTVSNPRDMYTLSVVKR
jgi:hypothetical protein